MKRLIYILLAIVCGNFCEASPAVTKAKAKNTQAPNNPEQILNKGKEAFYNYNFDQAANFFRQYSNLKNNEEAEIWEKQAQIASNAFERVQQIVVIDSISMPRASFYKAFKLPASAGRVGRPSDLNLKNVIDNDEVSFINEDKDYVITPVLTDVGEMEMLEYRKLLDGSWEVTNALEGDFEIDGDFGFPFLGSDGQTLYFSATGDGSMGGYDLFVVQKEPITGECLQPLNLGMPFNSPYDDLMMVVDEENGVGWWATDRNSPGGDITVYVYLLDDIRKNYPSDTDNLEEFAKVSDYKSTWEEGKEETYRQILNSIPK